MIAIVAIFAAMGLVGAVVVQSTLVPQQAFADCSPGNDGAFKNSKHNCFHPGK
jgi:hypothetical protein